MTKPVFDAGSFLSVNLTDGAIFSRENERLALVSTEILKMLPPSESVFQAAAAWGTKHGIGLGEQLTTGDADPGVEALAEHLGGTLAALGMGRVQVEIRGDALMFRTIEDADGSLSGMYTLLQGFLSGYLTALTGNPFTVLDLGPSGSDHLFWALSPDAAEVAQAQIERGDDPLLVIDTAMTRRAAC